MLSLWSGSIKTTFSAFVWSDENRYKHICRRMSNAMLWRAISISYIFDRNIPLSTIELMQSITSILFGSNKITQNYCLMAAHEFIIAHCEMWYQFASMPGSFFGCTYALFTRITSRVKSIRCRFHLTERHFCDGIPMKTDIRELRHMNRFLMPNTQMMKSTRRLWLMNW